jgi:hypothetical protein
MNDNKHNTRRGPEQPGRRRLLKLLAGTGAASAACSLPTAWARPLVEAVILPAQAQLSGGPTAGGSTVYSASTDITIVGMQQWLDGPLRPLKRFAGVRQEPGKSINDYFDVPRPAPSPALLDFFINPAEAIPECGTPAPIAASAFLTLFLDVGDVLQVVIDLSLNFTCESFNACSGDSYLRYGNLRFCWEGPVTGSTTNLDGDAGNCASAINGGVPARIVSRDDAAGTVTVEVLGQQYKLTPGGVHQVCAECLDQTYALAEAHYLDCSVDPALIENTLIAFLQGYFGAGS